jgi:hypothetical protein
MKHTFTIICLLLTAIVYGQKSTLIQNYNPRAKDLKHHLNKTEDSLILESNRLIEKVGIFNSAFEKKLYLYKNKVKISLKDVPVGRFVTEVKYDDKLILITLIRHKAFGKKTKIVSTEELERPIVSSKLKTETVKTN